jgi:hypothetical protein
LITLHIYSILATTAKMFISYSLSLLSLFASATFAEKDAGYNCRPGQSCWPSIQEWQRFNATVHGHLHETIPIAAPCYQNSQYFDEPACKAVAEYYGDSVSRGEHFGQTYWLNWETCRNSGCGLLESNPTETLYANCSLGRLASYYVDVREAAHISATLHFAKPHNIRLSIKNTGHDFFGRSSIPNSLAIWTHNLDTLQFYPNFTAHNCPSADGPNVGELAAGVIAGDAYRFFNAHGMDVTGGYEQSVGIAGGFAQGGGLGSFTTTYSLMADNAVEFEVVTADGELRIINKCNDPDLFWAMRCGGGGTFAVLTKYRVQLYSSLLTHIFTFNANFSNQQDVADPTRNVALREFLTAHASNQVDWSAQLVTGQLAYFAEEIELSLVLPYGDDGTKLNSATDSFRRFLSNRTDLLVSANNYDSHPDYATYLSITTTDAKITEPSGISSLLASGLIPRTVFANPATIDDLVEGVLEGIAMARSILNLTGTQIVLETPVSNLDSSQTSAAHPAWCDSL